MDASAKNHGYEWIEDEDVPPPSQTHSETGRYGERSITGEAIGRGQIFRDRPYVPRHDHEEFMVPTKDVGKIIGKGGSRIRELEDSSGARILIRKDDADYFDTKVEVRGCEEARRKARELIDEIVHPPELPKCPLRNDEPPPLVDWAALLARSEEERRKRWAALAPIVKNFYVEDPKVASMSAEEADAFRAANNNIVVEYLGPEGEPPPCVATNPVTTFEEAFSSYPEILDEIYKNKFERPTPIQSQAWPILLQGQDLIGIAQTGTGKTLAFLLPAMIHIDSQPVPREERKGPSCLVLAPTRELAQQIEREAKKYNYRNIRCVCVYGGGSRKEQIETVNLGVEIVIATPGRLNDLVMNKVIDLNFVTYLVLDEADRMLDMGFEIQIKKVMLDIRPDRQTVMTSATWPEGVHRLSDQYMKNPFQVYIGTLDLAAVHTVTQKVILCEEEEKKGQLLAFLRSMQPNDKVIVFADRKAMVDNLTCELVLAGIDCDSIHGSREQCDRERALEDLRSGQIRILIATDVAARGLDIVDVTHIFNYDFPFNMEEYVHRVGRTGRAGRTGVAITLITRENWMQARKLISILEEASQEVPHELYAMADRFDARNKRQPGTKQLSVFVDHGKRRGGGVW